MLVSAVTIWSEAGRNRLTCLVKKSNPHWNRHRITRGLGRGFRHHLCKLKGHGRRIVIGTRNRQMWRTCLFIPAGETRQINVITIS